MQLAPTTPLDAALEYARRGWPVIQLHHITSGGYCSCRDAADCKAPGKHPMSFRGLHDATTLEGLIRTSWARCPEANVGILCGAASGLVVLDVDGEKGERSLAAFEEREGATPATLTGITGRGYHLVFRHPGGKVKSSIAIAPGLDIRADGSYIVAAPSRHQSGAMYQWRDVGVDIAPMPAWLVGRRPSSNGAGGNGHRPVSRPDPTAVVPEGQRNQHIYKLACSLRAKGLGEAAILAACLEENVRQCKPPLDEQEVRKAVSSACTHPPGTSGLPGYGGRYEAEQPPTRTDSAPQQGGWAPPVSLVDERVLPIFPVDALPAWLRRFVMEEARALQVPVDLSAMLGLSVLAIACAKKVRVTVKPGYSEPVNLWTVTALPAGERKSPTSSAMVRPVEDFEKEEQLMLRPVIAKAEMELELLQKRRDNAQMKASKAKDDDERHKWTDEVMELTKKIVAFETPASRRLLAADTTPEKLVGLMAANLGRIGIISAEGEIFEIMAGRYSKSGASNIETFLKSHSGDNIRIDRMMRASEFVEEPALSLGLAVQPDVIRGLTRRREFRGRGLLARFLYSMPASLIGRRNTRTEPVPLDVQELYHAKVRALLKIPFKSLENDKCGPHDLQLSPEAVEALAEFDDWLEPRLCPGAEFEHMTDWAGKLSGVLVRIAGLLHMAEHAGAEDPWAVPISGQTFRNAITIALYAIEHARGAFDLMGADPVLEDAKAILEWLQRVGIMCILRSRAYSDDDDDDDDDDDTYSTGSHKSHKCLSRRRIHVALRSRFKFVDHLDAPLRLLVQHGYLRLREAEAPTGRGRPAGPAYEVNPIWIARVLADGKPESGEYVSL